MTEKNDFKLDVVSIRLVKEAPIYSEQSFNKPEEVAAVMGDIYVDTDFTTYNEVKDRKSVV